MKCRLGWNFVPKGRVSNMAVSPSTKSKPHTPSTGLLEVLDSSPTFKSQTRLVAKWIAARPQDARGAMRETAYFWSVRIAQLWGQRDSTDGKLVDALLETYGRAGRFEELLVFLQETLVGDDRYDAVVADAASQAIIAAIEFERLSEQELDKLWRSLS
jgi:hypothetical protein